MTDEILNNLSQIKKEDLDDIEDLKLQNSFLTTALDEANNKRKHYAVAFLKLKSQYEQLKSYSQAKEFLDLQKVINDKDRTIQKLTEELQNYKDMLSNQNSNQNINEYVEENSNLHTKRQNRKLNRSRSVIYPKSSLDFRKHNINSSIKDTNTKAEHDNVDKKDIKPNPLLSMKSNPAMTTAPITLQKGSHPSPTPKKSEPKKQVLDRVENDQVMFSKNFQIHLKGGTIKKLIEHCTESYASNSSLDTFLLTFRNFVTPQVFINLIFERYDIPPPDDDLTAIEYASYQENKKKIKLKIGNLIKRWIFSHFHDFEEDPELYLLLKAHVEETFGTNEPIIASGIYKTLEERQKKTVEERLMLKLKINTDIHYEEDFISVIDPVDIARQLTLYEQSLYKKIQARECLNQGWNKEKKDTLAPNITKMILHFNDVSRWVTTQIVQQKQLKNRVSMLKRFLKIAMKAKELNNFNLVQEILSGLSVTAVFRLRKSWAKIEKNKRFIEEYENLKSLMSTNSAYSKYRAELKKVHPPTLPYLGVFLTDLTFIEGGNSDYLTVQDGRNDIVNFEKLRKLAAVIEKITFYQQEDYSFPKVEDIYNYFEVGLKYLNDDEAFTLSREIEPNAPKE